MTPEKEIKIHSLNGVEIAEIIAEHLVIESAEDGLDLVGELYFQGLDRVVVYAKNITPAFFTLQTGIAGEVLQKFSNYRVRLAIVGDFAPYTSQSLQDFIFESNKSSQVNFVATAPEAFERLSQR